MVNLRHLLTAVRAGALASAICLLTPALAQTGVSQTGTASPPKVIFLFRHAEKPDGDKSNPNLTPVGFKRADALPTLFVPQPDAAQPGTVTAPRLPHPDVLFATAMSKHSNRPVETITPLARALHEPINNNYADDDYPALAKELLSGKYSGEVVVVCWHHGRIPAFAQALGVTGAPSAWNPDVYNQIWKIEWSNGQAHMTPISEALLPGDPPATN